MKNKPEILSKNKKVMYIGAHPDDVEFRAIGSAIKFKEQGAQVVVVSISDGSAGHHILKREDLAKRRREEFAKAASLIDAKSIILGAIDGMVTPDLDTRDKLIKLIREEAPDIIFTNRLCDYHPDHRYTAQLVQDASYLLMVPSVVPEVPVLRYVPLIMHWGDQFKEPNEFIPDIVISIDSVLEKKLDMLSCHESQLFEWLPWVDGNIDMVPPKNEAIKRREFLNWMYKKRYNHHIANRFRDKLREKYGNSCIEIQEAEAFRVCEYGYQPSELELKNIFREL